MHPGRLSGIAEEADQALGLVLRVFENQQADGFLLQDHGNSLSARQSGAGRQECETRQSTATSRVSQNLHPRLLCGFSSL